MDKTLNLNNYNKILINSLVNLGDTVLSTGAAALLKKANPRLKITMLVRPFAREIMEDNPAVDEVLVFGYQAKKKSWRDMWAMIKEIRRRKFDMCISLDRKLRPAICTFLAGIPVRLVPEKIFDNKPSRVTKFYNYVLPMPEDFVRTPQAYNFQRPLIKIFGLKNDFAKPIIGKVARENEEKAIALLGELPAAKLKIALCVKGSFPLKTWPKEYFLRLMKMLNDKHNVAFYIIGASGDRDYAEKFVEESKIPVANFCGRTSLKDLAALFYNSDLFISVDTGAVHIASTTTIPVAVMYGCGPDSRWPPLTDKGCAISTHEDCSPCHVRADECPYLPRPKCQWNITPEMVFARCEELLEKRLDEGV